MIKRLVNKAREFYHRNKKFKDCEEYRNKILSGESVENWIHCEFSFDEIHKVLVRRTAGPRVIIFDVGAHRGESIDRFHNIFPNALIHAFEPEEDNFRILQQKYGDDKRIVLNNYGFGSTPGTIRFFKNVKTDTSSCLPINMSSVWAGNKAVQAGVPREDLTEDVTSIQVTTIDKYMVEKGINYVTILKIDTQGYEDECLRGGQEALKLNQVAIIETEILVGDAYEKTLSFGEIENLIYRHGYRFFGINSAGNLLSRPHQSFDLIYCALSKIDSNHWN